MIVKRGNKYVVTSKDGSKTFGSHHTRRQAIQQLRAIEASKARRGSK
jgi:hypothetical protein